MPRLCPDRRDRVRTGGPKFIKLSQNSARGLLSGEHQWILGPSILIKRAVLTRNAATLRLQHDTFDFPPVHAGSAGECNPLAGRRRTLAGHLDYGLNNLLLMDGKASQRLQK